MEYITIQNKIKRSEEARTSLKLRLNEMKLRLKKRREQFHLECSSFIEQELSIKRQLNDSGCLLEEEFNTKQKVESLRNIKQLQSQFDDKLKKQQRERKRQAKLIKKELEESIVSVDISTFKKFIVNKKSSRTSTPIFNEKPKKRICKQKNTCIKKISVEKNSAKSVQKSSNSVAENKYFNIRENNFYNYSINLNSYEQKSSQYSSLISPVVPTMPLEFQDFGDFKVWYV